MPKGSLSPRVQPQWYPGNRRSTHTCMGFRLPGLPLGSNLGDNDPFCYGIQTAWVPLGSTLGDNDPFCITNVHI